MVRRYGPEAQVQLNEIRQAKALGLMDTFYYLTSSAIRKGISRLHSAI